MPQPLLRQSFGDLTQVHVALVVKGEHGAWEGGHRAGPSGKKSSSRNVSTLVDVRLLRASTLRTTAATFCLRCRAA